MKEYEVTVYLPGGAVYFRTAWLEGRGKAGGIAGELGELYGTEMIDLVERTTTRGEITFETLLHAEVWHGGTL